MTVSNDSGSPSHNQSPRLNGWKEIAAHVGRGVRTAQRWERELGMPVRRLRTGPGEAVYALANELDEWMARQSRSSLAPTTADLAESTETNGQAPADNRGQEQSALASATSRRRWLLGVAGTAAAVAVISWLGRGPVARPEPGTGPAAVEASGRTFRALGPDREVLWERPLSEPADWLRDPALRERSVAIGDLDGDHLPDVVFAGNSETGDAVYAWNHEGRPLFTHRFSRPVRFGSYACPPARATHVYMEPAPRFPGTVWVWGQHPTFFPAVLERLDSAGRVLSEYWSNGYIRTVRSVALGGRPITLVGGVNNDVPGASLAVFSGDVNGSAPSTNERYRCEGCPPGRPDAFLVFPRSRLQAVLGLHAAVRNVELVGSNRLVVQVEVAAPEPASGVTGFAYYTLDPAFRVTAVERDAAAATIQRAYELRQLVTDATRFRHGDLFPVRRWNGHGWDVIPGPEPEVTRPP